MMKKNIIFLLKLSLGIGLVAILISLLDVNVLIETISKANIFYLIFSFGLFLFYNFLFAFRFYTIINKKIKFYEIFKMNFASNIFTNILPTSIGGDAYKAMYIKKNLTNWTNSIYFIFVERVLGLLSLLFLGLCCLLFNFDILANIYQDKINLNKTLLYLFIIVSFILMILFYIFKDRLKHFLISIEKLDKIIVINVFMQSLFIHLVRVMYIYLILLSFDITLSLDKIIIVIVAVSLISVFSITVGAIGVKEGVMAYGFKIFGLTTEIGFATSLIERLFGILILPISIYYFNGLKKE